ncbi:MAG TPA: DUF4136 domain-containing protein [Salegentibacter sp.]|uniref:DUF4136 domain-containing protein n=1 Tax=Salegentibacter sp. TaxID=1903072 RepID=UPI002F9445F6
MRAFNILLLFLFLVSCNTPQAVYDYDQEVNFSNYSTYALFPDFRSGLSQLDEKRLLASLENQLQQKGFSASSKADMYVNVYTDEFREQNRNSVGIGVGGSGRNVGVGVSGGIPLGGPETYLQITFDFIDVKDDALIWQAVVESKFNPDASPKERQTQFQKIVQKALEAYPPKK